MPFREKSAWITLICLIVSFGAFFGFMLHGTLPPYGMAAFHYFIVSTIGFILLQIVLQVLNAVLAPKDARQPADEREKLILLKAGRNAHILLITGALIIPLGMHMGLHAPALMYHLMLALVVSEMVRSASQIVYFRLGR